MTYNQQSSTQKEAYNGIDLDYTLLDVSKALPSKGHFYPFKSILIRGLRFREQLEITHISKQQESDHTLKAVLRIYKECVKLENNQPFEDLLYEDLYAVCLWIVLLTNREQKWQMTGTCPSCSTKTVFEISPKKDLNLTDFKLDEPQTVDTEIGSLILSPMTIRDSQEFEDLDIEFKSELYNAQMIKKHNGKSLSIQERVDTYGMLSMKDITLVDDICRDFKVYMDDVIKVCPKCSNNITLSPIIDIKKGLP